MLISEVLDTLQILTKKHISQAEIARVLNASAVAINKRIIRNSEIKLSELELLEKHYNVSLLNKKTNTDDIDGIYYPDVFGSCGSGTFVLSETKEPIRIPQSCFNVPISKFKKYSVINAIGNSMEPYIHDRDKLIVQHTENGEKDLKYLKRLRRAAYRKGVNLRTFTIKPETLDN